MTQSPLIGAATAPLLHVMTFNIRRPGGWFTARRADQWARRKGALAALLRTEQPTVLGIQEAAGDQIRLSRESLGPAYLAVGYGRDASGGGESCPILYDAARLELLHWNQQALSKAPDEPGSASWGSRYPRILVAAVFRDRATTREFLTVNTQLDHFSPVARARAAVIIRERVLSSERQAIVLGDFNADAGSVPFRLLTGGGCLRDTWDQAADRLTEEWGTLHRYRRPRRRGRRIDWILVTPQVTVCTIGINTTRYGTPDGAPARWPSDHAPVQGLINLGSDPST